MRSVVYEPHDTRCRLDALLGVIRYSEPIQHVREAHDAQTDFSRRLRHLVYLGKRILVHIDDIIEEVYCGVDRLTEQIVIYRVVAVLPFEHLCKVNRT